MPATRRAAALIAAAIAAVSYTNAALAVRQPTPAAELVAAAEYVGFLFVTPRAVYREGEWRQVVDVVSLDPIKDALRASDRCDWRIPDDPFVGDLMPLRVYGDHQPRLVYPTSYRERGSYLVFLRAGAFRGRQVCETLAAFRFPSRPDSTGRIVDRLGSGRDAMDREGVRRLVRSALSGRPLVADMRSLDDLLAAASAVEADWPLPHERRMRDAEELAAAIRPGTTRADVNRVFPDEIGGCTSGSSCYYLSPDVVVEVPYATNGESSSVVVSAALRVRRGERQAIEPNWIPAQGLTIDGVPVPGRKVMTNQPR